MNKHRKIALALHLVNGLVLIVLAVGMFIISMSFTACTGGTVGEAAGPSCALTVGTLVGVPAVLAVLPLIALVRFGRYSRGYLWFWSVFIAIAFLPIGTAIGGHTIYLLRQHSRDVEQT